jgi:hypothetical protein
MGLAGNQMDVVIENNSNCMWVGKKMRGAPATGRAASNKPISIGHIGNIEVSITWLE